MATYTSNHVAYQKWIHKVHTDTDWRSPTAERAILPVQAEVAPDSMTWSQWSLAIGGLLVTLLFLVAVFLPIFV